MLLTGLLAAFSLPALAADNSPADGIVDIYASVYSTEYWREHNFDEVGIYRFNNQTYSRELVRQDPDLDASGGGVMTGDFYFCTQELDFGSWVDVTHYIIDPETWETRSSLRDGNSNAVATDLAYDPITAKIFGCFNADEADSPMVFGTINEATGDRFKIADIEVPWIACAVDKSGNLFAIDMEGKLMSVDKVRGGVEVLGNLGFTANSRSTGDIDKRTGIFYVVVTNSTEKGIESKLYAVDTKTATATWLYDFEDGEAMGGMYIPGEAAEDGAPAAATDLVVAFVDDSLTGTVSFNVPSTTFDGTSASGELDYIVRANGSLLAQGKAQFGSSVTADARVSEPGMYEIDVVLSNAVGRSPKTKIKQWIGADTPKQITDVKLEYSGNAFILTWHAPEGSVNGGYIDDSKISYTVTRRPDGIVVTKDLKETILRDPVAMPQGVVAYSYDVVMKYGTTSFMPVSSNVYRLGGVSLPYTATFEDEEALKDFTIIDLDGDRVEWYREWEFYVEATDELITAVVYPYSPSAHGADDWLITPPVPLTADNTYILEFDWLTDYLGDAPLLEIYAGSAPEVEAMNHILMTPTPVQNLLPEKKTIEFKVDTDGVYNIGFHACSEAGKSAIAMTSLGIREKNPSGSLDDIAASTLKVKSDPGRIEIVSDNDYAVYGVDGRIVAKGSGNATVYLPTGIYIVKSGKDTLKAASL